MTFKPSIQKFLTHVFVCYFLLLIFLHSNIPLFLGQATIFTKTYAKHALRKRLKLFAFLR